jgi:hypothetical protein
MERKKSKNEKRRQKRIACMGPQLAKYGTKIWLSSTIRNRILKKGGKFNDGQAQSCLKIQKHEHNFGSTEHRPLRSTTRATHRPASQTMTVP